MLRLVTRSSARRSGRGRRRIGDAVALGALLAGLLGLIGSPAAASNANISYPATTTDDAEALFLRLANGERSERGLDLLVADPALSTTSRSWSRDMDQRDTLAHDPNLVHVIQQVEAHWRSGAENVGVGYDVVQLHRAFMASNRHRQNILAPQFNRVGIGVSLDDDRIWVTVRFLEGPAIAVPTGLERTASRDRTAPLTGDFDGDGHHDILTYAPGSAPERLWLGAEDGTFREVRAPAVNGSYLPLTGDFNGDGRSEVIWYGSGTAADYLWVWRSTGWTSRSATINGAYEPASGDFDGDGRDDVIWYAAGTAPDYFWYGTDEIGSFSSGHTQVNGNYRPLAGDFDGDQRSDVFWYGRGGAPDYIWYSVPRSGAPDAAPSSVNGIYEPIVEDFDGDGNDDILWYAAGTAADYVWLHTSTRGIYRGASRTIVGQYLPGGGDFNGDGVGDVAWFTPSTAEGDGVWWGRSAGDPYAISFIGS